MHYEIGYHDDCKEMERAQNAVKKAADAYEAVANKLDDNTKEAIEGLLRAYSSQIKAASTYAYLQGVKHGIQFNEWVHEDETPMFADLLSGKDYTEKKNEMGAYRQSASGK
jgi:lipopolysaccharide biosynthesis regulator YciM